MIDRTLDTYSHLWPPTEDRTRDGATATHTDLLGRPPTDSLGPARTNLGSDLGFSLYQVVDPGLPPYDWPPLATNETAR